MTHTLTPDQVKKIASDFRKIEKDQFGRQIPQTTALNSIVRSLGYAQDYRAFKASFEQDKAPEETIELLGSDELPVDFYAVSVVMDAPNGQALISHEDVDDLAEEFNKDGWVFQAVPPVNQYALFTLTRLGKLGPVDHRAKKNEFEAFIKDLCREVRPFMPENAIAAEIKCSTSYPSHHNEASIYIEVVDRENDRSLTAVVPKVTAEHMLDDGISYRDIAILVGSWDEIDEETPWSKFEVLNVFPDKEAWANSLIE